MRLAMGSILLIVRIEGNLEEPPVGRQREVGVPIAEGGKVEGETVLEEGGEGGVDGVGEGVHPASAGVEEELAFEHEEDVEGVVFLGALLFRLGGWCGCSGLLLLFGMN